jgi:hypothetical protein
MAHHVARAIVDLAEADHARDLATTLQRRSFKLELSNRNCRFAELYFGFDGCGMVHARLGPYGVTAFSSMVVPESSLDFLVGCAPKLQVTPLLNSIRNPREVFKPSHDGTEVGTGFFKGKLVLRRAPCRGRALLHLMLSASSAEEVHKEVMAVVELVKAMQPAL